MKKKDLFIVFPILGATLLTACGTHSNEDSKQVVQTTKDKNNVKTDMGKIKINLDKNFKLEDKTSKGNRSSKIYSLKNGKGSLRVTVEKVPKKNQNTDASSIDNMEVKLDSSSKSGYKIKKQPTTHKMNGIKYIEWELSFNNTNTISHNYLFSDGKYFYNIEFICPKDSLQDGLSVMKDVLKSISFK